VHYGDMMWGWGHGGWWGWPMAVGMIAFWVVVVVLAVWLIRSLAANAARPAPGAQLETPLEVLKRRYAAGEIDRAEYEQKRSDLL
jgi:putative membrane protein